MNQDVLQQVQVSVRTLCQLCSALEMNSVGLQVLSYADQLEQQAGLMPESPDPQAAVDQFLETARTMQGYCMSALNPDPIKQQIVDQTLLLQEQAPQLLT